MSHKNLVLRNHAALVIVPSIRIVFQQFPGLATGHDRGLSGVPYRYYIAGALVAQGKTDADGAVTLPLAHAPPPAHTPPKNPAHAPPAHAAPAHAAPAHTHELEIFETRYVIHIHNPNHEKAEKIDTIRGVQRRLLMLGYELGVVDGKIEARTDRALLCFQADNNLAINGIETSVSTKKRLTQDVGG